MTIKKYDVKDILLDSAYKWKELINNKYVITYGYKNKLYTINLCFSPEEYQHLAGFHYLKDIVIPKYNSKVLIDRILEEKITYDKIIKSNNFETMVKPRLEALIILKTSLDSDFILYSYMKRMYPFTTTINADYIISYKGDKNSFTFIVKSSDQLDGEKNYLCCSVFTEGERDYSINQRQRIVLRKERIYIPSNESTILYNRLKI